MSIIRHIMQRVRPAEQQSGQVATDHPNFWMYQ